MSWAFLAALLVGISVAVVVSLQRRSELRRLHGLVGELEEARTRGTRNARLQYPQVDLARCLGCGTCVSACPENGVLEMIHGQAIVIHGARCVGHGLCAEECPTGAIVVALGDLESRDDIPAVDHRFEVPTVPGLFLAGEVTGFALIRTAITHGVAVAREVANRSGVSHSASHAGSGGVFDLAIVGAGPAGIACALEAKDRDLSMVVLEQEALGGTVASYPRRKLVMTQPVELPRYGRLTRTQYQKEELMELWTQIIEENDIPVKTGVRFERATCAADGVFDVVTDSGVVRARNVCLALGRRGTPRKLGVPGEELPKVAYSLLDAESYEHRRVLVVGGGDSAIEAALGLADQVGNEVTLSYRREGFFRIKVRNETRIGEAIREGRIQVLFKSQVVRISPETVELSVDADGNQQSLTLPNDEVFVFAGGIPPFRMLGDSGVSFAPEDRPPPPTMSEGNSGLLGSLLVSLGVLCVALAGLVVRGDYYFLNTNERPRAEWHDLLRPSGMVGLSFGIAAIVLLLANLSYLIRRDHRIPFRRGSLRSWMTVHVATGLLTLVLALLHAAMAPRDTVGGHALLGLGVLAVTGAIGRYFYSFVPRAANGRELELDEVKGEIAALSAEWDRGNRAFGDRARSALEKLVPKDRWRVSLPRRILMLLRAQWESRRTLADLHAAGVAEGIPKGELARTVVLAKRAQKSAFAASHYEELRGLIASWRYVHRWVALLLVLLIFVHIVTALRYGSFLD